MIIDQSQTGKTLDDLSFQFKKVRTAISAGWNVEHHPDGTHHFPGEAWTPTIGGFGGTSGQIYQQQVGHFIKTGALVTVFFTTQFLAKGTITGVVQLQNLPYAASTAVGPSVYGSGAMHLWLSLNTAMVQVTLRTEYGTTAANLYGLTAAATSHGSTLATTDLTNDTYFVGTLSYLTDE